MYQFIRKINRIWYIMLGLFALTLSILVHEFGHFVACKMFGIHTPIFSIGFGPTIFSYQINTTSFELAAFPLGGFVAINLKELAAKPYWHQLIIMLAGVIYNIGFAFIIFTYLGFKNSYRSILPNSPNEDISFLSKIQKSITSIPSTISQWSARLSKFFAQDESSGITGPIGIIQMITKSIATSWYHYMAIIGLLNVNLAIFNLLPIPVFDGGQIIIYTIQALYGPILDTTLELIQSITWIVLLFLVSFISIRDIKRLR